MINSTFGIVAFLSTAKKFAESLGFVGKNFGNRFDGAFIHFAFTHVPPHTLTHTHTRALALRTETGYSAKIAKAKKSNSKCRRGKNENEKNEKTTTYFSCARAFSVRKRFLLRQRYR